MAAKIRTAVAARKNKDFVIMARTDAKGVYGFDDAVQWAKQALAVAGEDAKALRSEIEQRLEEYRKNQPYRQPA